MQWTIAVIRSICIVARKCHYKKKLTTQKLCRKFTIFFPQISRHNRFPPETHMTELFPQNSQNFPPKSRSFGGKLLWTFGKVTQHNNFPPIPQHRNPRDKTFPQNSQNFPPGGKLLCCRLSGKVFVLWVTTQQFSSEFNFAHHYRSFRFYSMQKQRY